MTHVANAIQKDTSDTIVSQSQHDQHVTDSAIAVIHSRDPHDAGRHDRRERIRFHGVTITSADMITGRFSGRAATPIAVRACLPCSPNTSSRRSDAGLSTAVVCG